MNLKFLITAGPTQEPIDPVRYMSNRSSGKMGYALAECAVKQGANVTLISGPVNLSCPVGVKCIYVKTAQEMYDVVMTHVVDCDVFVSVAAVADYRVAEVASQKLKKNAETLTLSLIRNPDILFSVAQLKNPPFTVGFAAETENLSENAIAKLNAKKVDMVVANDVGDVRSGFNVDQNAVTVFWQGGEHCFPLQPKTQLAEGLFALIKAHRNRC